MTKLAKLAEQSGTRFIAPAQPSTRGRWPNGRVDVPALGRTVPTCRPDDRSLTTVFREGRQGSRRPSSFLVLPPGSPELAADCA